MRIDIPLCGFKYCKYSSDCNCTATDLQRERCDYLRYKQAEDEGRLVELPCKVGDKTYKVGFNCKDNPNPTRYCMCFGKTCKTCEKSFLDVFEVEHETSNIRSIVANMGLCGEAGGFGKTVFLTRKQAEQAKEGQDDK